MIKKLLLLTSFFTSIVLNAQTIEKTFSLGNITSHEYGYTSIELNNGNYLIGINNNILCLSSNGDSLWTKKYSTYGDILKIFRDQNQKLMIATTSGKMLIANIDESNGDVISSFYVPKQFSNSGYSIYDIEVKPNGDYIICYNNGGGNGAIVRCFTPQATEYKWSNDYAGQGYSPKSVLLDDTSIVLAGYVNANTWDKYFQIMKLSSGGKLIWKKIFVRNSTNYDRLVGLQKNSKGNYLAATSMVKNNLLLPSIVVMSQNGDSIAVNSFESYNGTTLNHGMLYDLSKAGDAFYGAGYVNINVTAPNQSIKWTGNMGIFKISDEGKFISSAIYNKLGVFEYPTNTYNGSDAWGNSAIHTKDGNYLLVGAGSTKKNTPSIVWKGYIVISNQLISNTNGVSPEIILNKQLDVFPNPSSGTITIQSYKNLNNGNAIIYNSFGQIVLKRTLDISAKAKIDLSNLLPGYYLLHVTDSNGDIIGNRKLILR
ncbi:MAG: T9SS type A sorting domain-containing protein [Bacteroidia bacterium]|nr:T9SS type A sorting domain-containing protein [Bacteroidia bacterium]